MSLDRKRCGNSLLNVVSNGVPRPGQILNLKRKMFLPCAGTSSSIFGGIDKKTRESLHERIHRSCRQHPHFWILDGVRNWNIDETPYIPSWVIDNIGYTSIRDKSGTGRTSKIQSSRYGLLQARPMTGMLSMLHRWN